jgi:hypothetical protein
MAQVLLGKLSNFGLHQIALRMVFLIDRFDPIVMFRNQSAPRLLMFDFLLSELLLKFIH